MVRIVKSRGRVAMQATFALHLWDCGLSSILISHSQCETQAVSRCKAMQGNRRILSQTCF